MIYVCACVCVYIYLFIKNFLATLRLYVKLNVSWKFSRHGNAVILNTDNNSKIIVLANSNNFIWNDCIGS